MASFNIWVPKVYLLLCEERKAWLFWLPINNKVWGSITDAEYLFMDSEVLQEGWATIWLLDKKAEYLRERHISNDIFPTSFSGWENAESET